MKYIYALVVVLAIISRLSGCEGGRKLKDVFPGSEIPSIPSPMSFDEAVGSLDINEDESPDGLDFVLNSFVKACQKMATVTRGVGDRARLVKAYKTMMEATRPILDQLEHQVAANHDFPSEFDEVGYSMAAAHGGPLDLPVSRGVPQANTSFNHSVGSSAEASGVPNQRGVKAWLARLVEENARAPQLDDENSMILNRSRIVTIPLVGVTSRFVPAILEGSETIVSRQLGNATTNNNTTVETGVRSAEATVGATAAVDEVVSTTALSTPTSEAPLPVAMNTTEALHNGVRNNVTTAVSERAANEVDQSPTPSATVEDEHVSSVIFATPEKMGVAQSDDACCAANYNTTVETGVRSAEATVGATAAVDEVVSTTALSTPSSEAPLPVAMNTTETLHNGVRNNVTTAASERAVGEVDQSLAPWFTVEDEHVSSEAPISPVDGEAIAGEALYPCASDEGSNGADNDDMSGPLNEVSTSDGAILARSNEAVSLAMTGADVVIEGVLEAENFHTERAMATSEDVAMAPQIDEPPSEEALVSGPEEAAAATVDDNEGCTPASDVVSTLAEATGVVNETGHDVTAADELEAVPADQGDKANVSVSHVEEAMCPAMDNSTLNDSVDDESTAGARALELAGTTPLGAASGADEAHLSIDDKAYTVVWDCETPDVRPCTMISYGVNHNEEEDFMADDDSIAEADAADDRSPLPLDEVVEADDALLGVPALYVEGGRMYNNVAADAVNPVFYYAAEGVPPAASGSCGGLEDRTRGTISAPATPNSSEAVSELVSEAVPEAVSEGVNEAVNEAVPDGVNEAVNEAVPEAVPEGINEAVNEAVHKAVSEAVSDEAFTTPLVEAAVPEELTTVHNEDEEAETIQGVASVEDNVWAEVSESVPHALGGDDGPSPSGLSPCNDPADDMVPSIALDVLAIVEKMNQQLSVKVALGPGEEAMPTHEVESTGATAAGNESAGAPPPRPTDNATMMSVNASASDSLEDFCPVPADYYYRQTIATAGNKDAREIILASWEGLEASQFLPFLYRATDPTISESRGLRLEKVILPPLRSPLCFPVDGELQAILHTDGDKCLAYDNKSLYYLPAPQSTVDAASQEGHSSLHVEESVEEALDTPPVVVSTSWFNASSVKMHMSAAVRNGGKMMQACGSSVAHYGGVSMTYSSAKISQFSSHVETTGPQKQQALYDEYQRAVRATEAVRFEQACVSCMCRSALGTLIVNETDSSALEEYVAFPIATWAKDACAICRYWTSAMTPSNTSELSAFDCGHAKLLFAATATKSSWNALAFKALYLWFCFQLWTVLVFLGLQLSVLLRWLVGKGRPLAWSSVLYVCRFGLYVVGFLRTGRAYVGHRGLKVYGLLMKIDLTAAKEAIYSLSLTVTAATFADSMARWLADLFRGLLALCMDYIFGFWALWPTCVSDLAKTLTHDGLKQMRHPFRTCVRMGWVNQMGGSACSAFIFFYGIFHSVLVILPPVGLLAIAYLVREEVYSGVRRSLTLVSHKLRLPRRLPVLSLRAKLLLGALAIFLFAPITSASVLTSSSLHTEPATVGQCLVNSNSSFANSTVLLDPLSSVLPTVRFGRAFVCHTHKDAAREANVLVALVNFRLDCQLELQFVPVSLLLLIGIAFCLYRRLNESCRQMGISVSELALFPLLLLADTVLCLLVPDEHVIRLQANVRTFLCRRRFLAFRSRTIKLQSWTRMLHHRALFALTRTAAVTIQRAVRQYLASPYRSARLLSLTAFQAIVRRRFTHRQYQTLLHSTRPRTPTPPPSPPLFTLPFVLLLQRFARRVLALRRRARWLRALTRLQAIVRGRLPRRQYLRTLDATLCLQCYIRRFLVSQHTHLLLLDHSAITLQATIRGYLSRLFYLRAKRLAIYLQALVRRHLASKKLRTLRQSVITIQAAMRGYAARLYVAMVRSRKQRNKMRAMVRAWCVQMACVDGTAVRRFWQDMASAHSELLAVPLFERLLQRLVSYHHPKLRSLEDDLALSWGTDKGRARGERSRQRHLTDACWGFLLEARTREGVVAFDMESLRRARLGYLDYRLRGHANELKGMKPWSAEGAIFLSVTVAAWKREWKSLTGDNWPLPVQQYRW